MGGKTVFTADIPVVKGTSGIVVLAHTAGTVKKKKLVVYAVPNVLRLVLYFRTNYFGTSG